MEVTGIFLFIGDIGGSELILILFAILVLFGAKRIPELARGLGQGIREFKEASREIRHEIEHSIEAKPVEAEQADINPIETKTDRQTLEP